MGIFDRFLKTYREGSVSVRDGVPSANEGEEMDAWPMRRDPKNTVSSGGYRVLDSEHDSRRGTWPGAGAGLDGDGEPDDPMSPGWRGDALDDGGLDKLADARGLDKVNVRCPSCGETSKIRLPRHIKLAKTAYASETEGKGRIMRTQCGSCSESIRFHAPEGMRFVNRESAAVRHFTQRYGYLTGRSRNPITRGLKSAREAFKRSYFGR